MNYRNTFVSRVFIYLAGLCFFLAANTFVLFSVVNADNLKQTLSEEGTYEKIVPAVLATANYSQDEAGQLPLQEPWVQEAAQKAFPASDLEQKGSAAIDGTFAWLEGETEKPQFALDFTANKQLLAEELGNSAEARLTGLPRCRTIPASIDAFNIECLPFGVSPSVTGDTLTAQYVQDDNFLKDTVITPETFSMDSAVGTPQEAIAAPPVNLDGLRAWYQNGDLLKWLLPLLVILFAATGAFLAKDKHASLRRLARALLGAAVGLAVFALLMSFGLDSAMDAVAKDEITRNVLSPVLLSLVNQARDAYLIFAGIGLAAAIALFVTSKRISSSVSRL